VRLGRSRFRELVDRQLDLFVADEGDLLAEAGEAEEAWNRSGRDGAEEAYGDYQLVVDAIADRLLETRETYAATLAEREASEYRAAFDREASRRFRRHPTIAADLADEPDA
jgi:hypothetical protein